MVSISPAIPEIPLPSPTHSNPKPVFLPPLSLSLSLLSLSLSLSFLLTQLTHSQEPLPPSPFMELNKRQDHSLSERKGQKRKLDDQLLDHRQISAPPPTADERAALLAQVSDQVRVLHSTFTWNEADRAAAKRATHALADLAKNGKNPCLRSRIPSPRSV